MDDPRARAGAESQMPRRGCRARGGLGRQHPNPSALCVVLEEAQGGAGALGQRDFGGPRPEQRLHVLAPIHTDKVGALEPSYATLAADADPLKTWPRDLALAGLWRGHR
jgi:hypothetical protein